MTPLQLTRIFDYQQPTQEQSRTDVVRSAPLQTEQKASLHNPSQEERRKQQDRRILDRREMQHATFLNTRKIQGRRRLDGRRASDKRTEYFPISLKG